jgi:hypothetical protein
VCFAASVDLGLQRLQLPALLLLLLLLLLLDFW